MGKELPPGTDFGSDDGSADPQLQEVLQQYAAGGSPSAVVDALLGKRLLVPVLAELEVGEVTAAGHKIDKEASASVVAVRSADGRAALPVFTSVSAMKSWNPQARPVPVTAQRAALSAVSEDWALLVLDPAGPVSFTVPRPAVWALAQAKCWNPALEQDTGQVRPEIVTQVAAALGSIPQVLQTQLLPGKRAEVAVQLTLQPGMDQAQLNRVITQVNQLLAANEIVAEQVDSLELRLSN